MLQKNPVGPLKTCLCFALNRLYVPCWYSSLWFIVNLFLAMRDVLGKTLLYDVALR